MFPTRRPFPPMNTNQFMGRPPGFSQQTFFPQQFPSQQGMRPRGLGGLFQKIFSGRSGVQQGFMNHQNLQGMSGGLPQGLQGITNPANLSSMMGNIQKVLGVAERVMPMVQQYGPLIKNAPAMLKIYSQLKNSNDEDDDNDNEIEEVEDNSKTKHKVKSEKRQQKESDSTTNSSKRKSEDGSSKPKLYI
ncbi:YqfQ family protein [Bacillus timonensis]|nr:YqfQ family protein [Bacillus timonensis]